MLKNRKSGRKGFTLIELLVVVLILAILMAIALPLYLNAVADSQLKTCRSNMQTIANAVQAARVQGPGTGQPYPDYTFAFGPVSTAIEKDLQVVPSCPVGGHYTVVANVAAGYQVHCDAAAHAGSDYIPGGL